MSFLGVTYVVDKDKDENFNEFLDALPISPETAEKFLKAKPSTKLEKDGETYISTTNVPEKGDIVVKFESGVELDEQVNEELTAKSTYTVEDNVVTQVQKFPDDNAITYKREYTDSELIVTITTTGWDGVAKRYYVAQ